MLCDGSNAQTLVPWCGLQSSVAPGELRILRCVHLHSEHQCPLCSRESTWYHSEHVVDSALVSVVDCNFPTVFLFLGFRCLKAVRQRGEGFAPAMLVLATSVRTSRLLLPGPRHHFLGCPFRRFGIIIKIVVPCTCRSYSFIYLKHILQT